MQEELNNIFEQVAKQRDDILKAILVKLIKRHCHEDITDWDLDRTQTMLDMKGYQIIIEPNDIMGSLNVGLYNNASKSVIDGYEIMLNLIPNDNGDYEITIETAPLKRIKVKK